VVRPGSHLLYREFSLRDFLWLTVSLISFWSGAVIVVCAASWLDAPFGLPLYRARICGVFVLLRIGWACFGSTYRLPDRRVYDVDQLRPFQGREWILWSGVPAVAAFSLLALRRLIGPRVGRNVFHNSTADTSYKPDDWPNYKEPSSVPVLSGIVLVSALFLCSVDWIALVFVVSHLVLELFVAHPSSTLYPLTIAPVPPPIEAQRFTIRPLISLFFALFFAFAGELHLLLQCYQCVGLSFQLWLFGVLGCNAVAVFKAVAFSPGGSRHHRCRQSVIAGPFGAIALAMGAYEYFCAERRDSSNEQTDRNAFHLGLSAWYTVRFFGAYPGLMLGLCVWYGLPLRHLGLALFLPPFAHFLSRMVNPQSVRALQ
jgi:hypothetical protein